MALVADGHRQLHAVMPNLSGIDIGLRRHDIVKRRQAKPPAGQQEYAEVLRMAVRRSEQPEYDLRLEKQSLVRFRFVARSSEFKNVANAGTAIVIILAGWRHREGLAAGLLRQRRRR